MIEWRDQGTVLSTRKHGETSVILDVFTATHGRHTGLVRGGISRKIKPHLQPGTQVSVTWKARLDTHLGSFSVEPIRSRAATAMSDRLALAGLAAVTSLLTTTLAERDPQPELYTKTIQLLDLLGQTDVWPLAYLQWELALLRETGFGLELDACTLTGANDRLIYISPKSGRAVAASAAGDWAHRLLPLPDVLRGEGDATPPDIAAAMATTGHFIEHKLIRSLGDAPMPAARARLIEALHRLT